jgi:hypothetical protein
VAEDLESAVVYRVFERCATENCYPFAPALSGSLNRETPDHAHFVIDAIDNLGHVQEQPATAGRIPPFLPSYLTTRPLSSMRDRLASIFGRSPASRLAAARKSSFVPLVGRTGLIAHLIVSHPADYREISGPAQEPESSSCCPCARKPVDVSAGST